MIDYNYELEIMIANKNLMNSYKLYFLKAVIANTSNSCYEFSFYEMACWMVSYSFSDICALGKRIRPLDRLYDVVVMAISTEDLMESSKVSEVYEAIIDTEDKLLRRSIALLCDYVPYRLLSYMWSMELKGKTDRQKNRIIAELSQSDPHCLYSIFTTSQQSSYITVNSDWISFINMNREQLISWIDHRIDVFIRGKK